MNAALVYSSAMESYKLSAGHPLDPVRLRLSVDLMRDFGLFEGFLDVLEPAPADDATIQLVHTQEYVHTVKEASASPARFMPRMGLGSGDNPVFAGIHEASALIAGGSVMAMNEVLSGRRKRTFSIAGGLHHAHEDRAAGFCVYNDPAIAIAWALARHPSLKVAYIDIDAHHGDGVQEAFYDNPSVLTVSIHESGMHLFPGTGFVDERGTGEGEGYTVNVPLPPNAYHDCYRAAMAEVVRPAVRAFSPDILVTQNGCDAHHSDPLTSLGLTVRSYQCLVDQMVRLADESCDGRLVALGGGGYSIYDFVPKCWTLLAARLGNHALPDAIPLTWRDEVRSLGAPDPGADMMDDEFALDSEERKRVFKSSLDVIRRAKEALLQTSLRP